MTAYLWGFGVILLAFTLLVLLPVIRVVKPKSKDTNSVANPTPVVTTTEKPPSKKKTYLVWIFLTVIVFLISINLYQWITSNSEKVDMDFPEIELRQIGKRNGVVIPMDFSTEAKVHILAPLTKVGIAHELCREVVEPIRVLGLVDTPKRQVESDDPNKIGVTHHMYLSREMKKFLFRHNVKEVRVNFYLIEKWAEDPPKCN